MRRAKCVHNVWIFIVLCLQSSICCHSYKKAEVPQPLDPWSLITCKTDRQMDRQTRQRKPSKLNGPPDHIWRRHCYFTPIRSSLPLQPFPTIRKWHWNFICFSNCFFLLLVCKCAKLLMEMNVFSSWIVDLSFVSYEFILIRAYSGNFHLELDQITHYLVNLTIIIQRCNLS